MNAHETIGATTFVETATNPAPAGGKVVWVEGKGGAAIRTAVWPNPEGCTGTVFLMPGKGEYIEKYFEVIGELLTRSFAVVCVDWRGQGLSTRQTDHPVKAFIGKFEDFMDDFEAVFAAHSKDLQGPWLGMAHSMGGNIALRLVAERRVPLEALVVTAPMTGLNMSPFQAMSAAALARVAVALGRSHMYVPGAGAQSPLEETFEGNSVTSDAARHERTMEIIRACPQIAQGGPTFGWAHEALASIGKVVAPGFGQDIDIPVMIVAASKDQLVNPDSNRKVASTIPGARFQVIEGAAHEVLMEQDEFRARFWGCFDSFIKEALGHTA